MSHSKRNTSRAVFTSYERSLAKAVWSASSARLTRDSFLPFASCSLCLELAQDPVACPTGDIFCRECALNNILAQKKELRRLEKVREQEERDHAERQARDDAEDQARAVKEFELVQAGLEAKGGKNANGSNGPETKPKSREVSVATPTPVPTTTKLLEAPPGADDTAASTKKRKFALDDDELQRISKEDRSKARKAIDAERAAANDARALPSFWTPSETPSTAKKEGAANGDANKNGNGRKPPVVVVDVAGGTTLCPAGHDRHPYSLHTLVSIQFERDAKDQRVCPACHKMLTNASKAVLAKPCGHVLCRSCVHKFVKPEGAGGQAVLFDPHAPPGTTGTVRCYVCEADLEGDGDGGEAKGKKGKKDKKDKKDKKKEHVKPGLVDLKSEGTGFSAGGASEVKKNGVAFQC
ncbi:hypothetical protein SCUCBS95973_005121 [Sporothrix curviconia]|uniref:RING-type domain-containing protein n=1 Tax=Sporothrix curviconia TaxID=1260050 RepID=A0ABP0BU57_9PEZI